MRILYMNICDILFKHMAMHSSAVQETHQSVCWLPRKTCEGKERLYLTTCETMIPPYIFLYSQLFSYLLTTAGMWQI